ncbi:alpha/beta fold hydrolase [Phenylobacterium sp. LjRoot219]|uniref:alpha/beta hydrolase n=1 Tax=Phenylobacterium sp. LjRoot219 TaxID=3342283 RepID=UPI003ECE119A
MATYVLVHGGHHGGWCYQKVARLLRAAGHEVYAPTLTGLGDRRHLLSPEVDLEMHVADVVNLLVYEDLHDVILAGHSYGGMVITGAADQARERIRELVYLDAAHPRNGESLADVAVQIMEVCRDWVREIDGVELVTWPQTLDPAFFGVTDPADSAWMRARLHLHPWRCYTQKLQLTDEAAVRRLPRTDIDCAPRLGEFDDRRKAERREADRAWEIDTGHDLMVTEPEKLAEMLLRLA